MRKLAALRQAIADYHRQKLDAYTAKHEQAQATHAEQMKQHRAWLKLAKPFLPANYRGKGGYRYWGADEWEGFYSQHPEIQRDPFPPADYLTLDQHRVRGFANSLEERREGLIRSPELQRLHAQLDDYLATPEGQREAAAAQVERIADEWARQREQAQDLKTLAQHPSARLQRPTACI